VKLVDLKGINPPNVGCIEQDINKEKAKLACKYEKKHHEEMLKTAVHDSWAFISS
jgi:hypothetical protein